MGILTKESYDLLMSEETSKQTRLLALGSLATLKTTRTYTVQTSALENRSTARRRPTPPQAAPAAWYKGKKRRGKKRKAAPVLPKPSKQRWTTARRYQCTTHTKRRDTFPVFYTVANYIAKLMHKFCSANPSVYWYWTDAKNIIIPEDQS